MYADTTTRSSLTTKASYITVATDIGTIPGTKSIEDFVSLNSEAELKTSITAVPGLLLNALL